MEISEFDRKGWNVVKTIKKIIIYHRINLSKLVIMDKKMKGVWEENKKLILLTNRYFSSNVSSAKKSKRGREKNGSI